ncbi:putative tetratricopeptide repeat protein 11 [Cardiosporidium cionae]|uniref:Tetratricopeptide repeat protein 11 n=1 Tax=Cardiosporidium cionae TaxID=476202 RepID=A0ABQ7J4Y5_9APIC|nr:putative tetratricopeptide repeat protein 11 [Cardiosporidium cionae]|eukprot:KAF8819080.1 putative tetratricopeptide repeat protein 11 [Cardiosporidium cionae]
MLQSMSDQPSARLQFEYASLLLCSSSLEEIREAIELFNELLEIGFNRSESLYQISLGYLKLGEYSAAKSRAAMLLKMV